MPAMRVALIVLAVLVVIGIAGVMWAVGINNTLVGLDQEVASKWAQVQNVYQRRADLIPNLVETVKGYASHEREVLEGVTRARASATSVQLTPEALSDPEMMRKFQAAQAQLSGALSRLLVTVEKYPDLKANQNFLSLQTQLEGTENRIATERQRFNDAVRNYNVQVRRVPNNIVAGMFGFRAKAFFEAAPDAATPPRVKF
jgi:LemA protein